MWKGLKLWKKVSHQKSVDSGNSIHLLITQCHTEKGTACSSTETT